MAFTRKAAIGLLRRAHNQKRLGHAYLISGPAGSGKREVAAELASTVNGTDAGDVFSSKAREIFVAEPESKSRRILIEQIRELEHGLQMRGAEGRCKVAIIAEADRLQPQAANAFLKTLEEPPANSLLLLLSALPEALPDTIVSRCISIPLAANGDEVEIPERAELVELLRATAHEKNWGVQQAYRVGQGLQSCLGAIFHRQKRKRRRSRNGSPRRTFCDESSALKSCVTISVATFRKLSPSKSRFCKCSVPDRLLMAGAARPSIVIL